MRAVAFNGSPRRKGNTSKLIRSVLDILEEHDIQCEQVDLSGNIIRGCTSCYMCRKNKNMQCANNTDIVNDCIKKMIEADVIIMGSPTYFAGMTPELKALIDRSGYVARGNNNLFSRKIGVAIAAVQRAGALNVLSSINEFFLINDMIVPGSVYWNLGIGDIEGNAEVDELSRETMKRLGENVAWLLSKIKK